MDETTTTTAPPETTTPEVPHGTSPNVPETKPVDADSPFAEIERLDTELKPKEKAQSKPEPKPATTEPDEKAKTETKPATETPDKPPEKAIKATELRSAYENLKKEHSALKNELQALKIKPSDEPEKAKFAETLASKDKQIAELQEQLRFFAYESSEEYKQKYETPFVDAYNAGRERAASLKITDADGQTRKGTAEDFDSIMAIGDDDTAAEKAAELFGAKAPVILYHRERVKELHQSRVKAIQEYRKTRSEREKSAFEEQTKQRADAEKQHAETSKLFHSLNTQAAEKFPQWFKPEEGDDKGNELLEKGMKLVDIAFNGNGNMPPEKIVQLHSAIRNKAGAFDRVVYKLKTSQNRIAELEKELSEFKKSGPGAGGGTGKPKETKPMSADDEIDALEKIAGR